MRRRALALSLSLSLALSLTLALALTDDPFTFVHELSRLRSHVVPPGILVVQPRHTTTRFAMFKAMLEF